LVCECDDVGVSGLVVLAEDANAALEAVGEFLRSDPVQHNLVLTLLGARAAHPEPGRYAWVLDSDEVVGVTFQSPLDFQAVVTAMPAALTDALVDQLAVEWADVPGVFGPADATSRFAGRWAETLKVPVNPIEGQRLYELGSLHPPVGVPGTARPASDDDHELVLSWVHAFEEETGATVATADAIRRRLDAGLLWIWEHDQPVAMATYTRAVAGVSRVGLVYTAPDRRRRGYGAACTAAVTLTALEAGAERCVLYTQLHNPDSNAIYRRLGYQPISEHLRYAFKSNAAAG
jgi:GNAT superfamily N-acetyltransferase